MAARGTARILNQIRAKFRTIDFFAPDIAAIVEIQHVAGQSHSNLAPFWHAR
jgi:hypothetical protein